MDFLLKNKDYYIKLYSCIKMVSGIVRSALYDLNRNLIYFIPNDIFKLLEKINNKRIDHLLDHLESLEDNKYYYYWLDYLNNLECIQIFSFEERNLFPEIDTIYYTPRKISFLELDSNLLCSSQIGRIISEINSLIIPNIIIYIQDISSYSEMEKVLSIFENSVVTRIILFINYDSKLFEEIDINENKVFYENPRLFKLIFYNYPNILNSNHKSDSIMLFNENLSDIGNKNISNNLIVVNVKAFGESDRYNLFYNERIYLSEELLVYNGFLKEKYYGNYQKMNFSEILNNSLYKDFVIISKEQIIICNQCEFRKGCSDNRIPVKGNKLYYHTTECQYNPYVGKWKDEQGYKNLHECGVNLDHDDIIIQTVL